MDRAMMTGFTNELADIYMEKEAILKRLLGKAPKAKKFVPSFQGHSKEIAKAVGPAHTRSATGVVTKRSYNPMTQTKSQARHVEGVPGWTEPLAQAA